MERKQHLSFFVVMCEFLVVFSLVCLVFVRFNRSNSEMTSCFDFGLSLCLRT